MKEIMLILQNLTYIHPDRDLLFSDIHLTLGRQDKIALTGNNGAGKSTLLKIMAGILSPTNGIVKAASRPYYVPQHFGQFNDHSIAQALGIHDKLNALKEILDGHVTESNLKLLEDDWAIEERGRAALLHWELDHLELTRKMSALSGGQKTKVFLAGIRIHQPEIVLLDEPGNHLDTSGRSLLYDYIKSTGHTLVVVSHDSTLLNLLNTVYELGKQGITMYGGNYDFYTEQKAIEAHAFAQELKSTEKAHRKAKETERESLERQQKRDARGKKKQEKAGLPTISMNTFRNNAENSTARMKGVHAEKVTTLSDELYVMRKALPAIDKMKLDLDNSGLHAGKVLITARDINFGYHDQMLWKQGLNFQISSGERIAVEGINGSGKTTLIKMILGEIPPSRGTIDRSPTKAIYIDQDYSFINPRLTIYEQARQYNVQALAEHEIKIRLNRFLFTKASWHKACDTLSGGEKMRLTLCCLTIHHQAPDMIILDEPTNNLDRQNLEILTAAINEYKGTLLVISHDTWFLNQISVQHSLVL